MKNKTPIILLLALIASATALIAFDKLPAEQFAAVAAGVMGWLIKSPREE